ncbi:hypothetical protein P5W99_24590 [Paraburkholderia sp. A3BS-1L]|uniref:hypothetical protein n=1 Tax=Paraburkholderia sp. A3BS-1L TaxID=3028375 RepID=UPI003DA8C9A8
MDTKQALATARAALYGIAKTYDDTELRQRANEAYESTSTALAHSDAAGAPTVPQAVLDALRFYGRGYHYNIDEDQQQFDTVSGEPQNWLFSERDDDCTMIEDGSIARAALCGCAQGFEEPPEPLEGEVLLAAPVAPAAPKDMLPNALWTRHGSGGSFEWWSFKGYEARKDSADQWVLRKAGEELYRHTYLQVVMAHAERAILATAPDSTVAPAAVAPTNAAHVMRRIRRCENETAAQLVLEHFAREHSRRALEEAARLVELNGYDGAAVDIRALFAAPTPTVAADAAAPSERPDVKPLNGIPATLQHDEGAIARCSYRGRYSLDPKTLSDRQPKCDCGERYGWRGSFKKPDHDAKWSGSAPQAAQPVDPFRQRVERLLVELHNEDRLSEG